MLLKIITVHVRPGHIEAFLERQAQWNDVMSRQPGFIDVRVAQNHGLPERITVLATWEDQESLDRFMAGEHDEIERSSGIKAFYEHIDVQLFEILQSAPEQ